MRCLRFILFLGLLGLSFAAPNGRDNRTAIILDRCRRIFKTSCVLPTGPVPTQPTIDESRCVCVPHSQCSQPPKIDRRFLSETPINNSGIQINTRKLKECARWDHICCDRPYIESGMPAVSDGCGYRNPAEILLRITDTTNEARFAEFPWMVAILQSVLNGPKRKKFKCGGAIIHPRAVLTAAHNVENFLGNPTDLIVRAGEWDTYSITEMIPHQERRVETIILHENFNTNNLDNDFAILILGTAFDIAQNVDRICLPQETDVFDGARCVVTGWGKDKAEKEGKFQAILKKIELPVLTYDVCQTSLRSTRLGRLFKLGQSFICAGGERNQDTCVGDGGGPLVCPMPNAPDRYVQAGIVSWGIGCGQAGIPGVYASVAYARQWIDSKLALHILDTTNTECVDSDEICCDTRAIDDTISNTTPKSVCDEENNQTNNDAINYWHQKIFGRPYSVSELPPVFRSSCTCVLYYKCSPVCYSVFCPMVQVIQDIFNEEITCEKYQPIWRKNRSKTPQSGRRIVDQFQLTIKNAHIELVGTMKDSFIHFTFFCWPSKLCPGLLDICCPNSSILSETKTTSLTSASAVPKNPSQRCRFRNPKKDNEAKFGEFPWMVVVAQRSYEMLYECGGSLIHPRAVLTAAHTTQKYVGRPGDLFVRAGEWDVKSEIEPLVHQERDVDIVIVHENFNPGDLCNDFAVLILRTDFEIAPHINTIHLPQPSEVFEAVRCVASGWGKHSGE